MKILRIYSLQRRDLPDEVVVQRVFPLFSLHHLLDQNTQFPEQQNSEHMKKKISCFFKLGNLEPSAASFLFERKKVLLPDQKYCVQ